MKAIVIEQYGGPDVLQLREVEQPTAKADEVLIKVHATTVSSADWRLRSATFPTGFAIPARLALGVFRPRRRVLGSELAGEIVSIGEDVTKFQVGDRVFAHPGSALGCYVEYRTMPEDGKLAPIPEGLSYEKAAALSFGGSTALNFLRHQGRIQAGESVLIIGASGFRGVGGGAAGQALRRRGHRRVQHSQPRARAVARGRRCHRLHAGRLHQERPHLMTSSSMLWDMPTSRVAGTP